MKKIKNIIIVCLIAFLPNFANGQTEKPVWIDESFTDLDDSYLEVGIASGNTENEARENAINAVLKQRGITTGARICIESNGDISFCEDNELTVKARKIDEYSVYNNKRYTLYVLVQIAKNPDPYYKLESVQVTAKYPFSPRVFVPGMAQIYKGSVGKGSAIIAGEVVFIGGIVVSEMLRLSYKSKIDGTHNPQLRQTYTDNANVCKLSRNIAIGGLVAIYAYNIIDGCVAKGKKHVLVNGKSLSFLPYATPYGGGIFFTLKF